MDQKAGKCLVCGKKLIGRRRKIMACMSCKIFYRRSIKRKSQSCFFGGHCSTKASDNQRRCKACRFWKCHSVLGKKASGAVPIDIPINQSEQIILPEETRAENPVVQPEEDQDIFEDILSDIDLVGQESPGIDTVCVPDSAFMSPKNKMDYLISSLDVCFDYIRAVKVPQKPSIRPARTVPDFNAKYFGSAQIQPDFPTIWKSLWHKIEDSNCLVPLHRSFGYSGTTCAAKMPPTIVTMRAVAAAADFVFGDQIADWRLFQRRSYEMGYNQNPSVDLHTATEAINYHNGDNIVRTLTFASLLPGMDQLDAAARIDTRTPWKSLVCYTIHHSPFLIGSKSFVTMGPQQLHLPFAWLEQVSQTPVYTFLFKFAALIRDLELTQTELYILIAIVLFEPGDEDSTALAPSCLRLTSLHQYYLDLLLVSIKQRSTSTEHVAVMGRKLETFFDGLYEINRLHDSHFSMKVGRHGGANCSVVARYLVCELLRN